MSETFQYRSTEHGIHTGESQVDFGSFLNFLNRVLLSRKSHLRVRTGVMNKSFEVFSTTSKDRETIQTINYPFEKNTATLTGAAIIALADSIQEQVR